MCQGVHALLAFGPSTFEAAPSVSTAQGVLKALFPIAAYLVLAPALYLVFSPRAATTCARWCSS